VVCSLDKPTAIDGTLSLKIIVVDTTGTLPCNPNYGFVRVDHARVKIKSTDYDFFLEFFTDENGELVVENLLASHYQVAIDKQVPTDDLNDFTNLVLTGSLDCNICPTNQGKTDTIKMDIAVLSNVVINEIYYTGVTLNNYPYLDDQFVELYNNSDKTLYLDSIILARMSINIDYIGTDYVEVVYAYQFPGKGHQCPIQPGELIVIAQDAIDHREVVPRSIDLSDADYECWNEPGNDIGGKAINLLPLNPNYKNDFMMNTLIDAILLIKMKNTKELKFNHKGYMLFKVTDVIDGVKYASSSETERYLDPWIDAGHAGDGIHKFSGESIERHHPVTGEPGYDTNNSSFDFVSLFHPTPGYQHCVEDVIRSLF